MRAQFLHAGIYSPDGKPVSYHKASDAEMAWLLKQLADDDKEVRAIAAGALGQPITSGQSNLFALGAQGPFFTGAYECGGVLCA